VKQSKRRKQQGRALVKTPSHRSHTVSLAFWPRSLASGRGASLLLARLLLSVQREAKAKAQRLERQDTESSLVLGKLARRAHAAYEKGTRLEA
jgi:hypothetical protein